MNPEITDGKYMEFLKEWWEQILMLIGCSAYLGTLHYRFNAHEKLHKEKQYISKEEQKAQYSHAEELNKIRFDQGEKQLLEIKALIAEQGKEIVSILRDMNR